MQQTEKAYSSRLAFAQRRERTGPQSKASGRCYLFAIRKVQNAFTATKPMLVDKNRRRKGYGGGSVSELPRCGERWSQNLRSRSEGLCIAPAVATSVCIRIHNGPATSLGAGQDGNSPLNSSTHLAQRGARSTTTALTPRNLLARDEVIRSINCNRSPKSGTARAKKWRLSQKPGLVRGDSGSDVR